VRAGAVKVALEEFRFVFLQEFRFALTLSGFLAQHIERPIIY
jgi:hypothetical protein